MRADPTPALSSPTPPRTPQKRTGRAVLLTAAALLILNGQPDFGGTGGPRLYSSQQTKSVQTVGSTSTMTGPPSDAPRPTERSPLSLGWPADEETALPPFAIQMDAVALTAARREYGGASGARVTVDEITTGGWWWVPLYKTATCRFRARYAVRRSEARKSNDNPSEITTTQHDGEIGGTVQIRVVGILSPNGLRRMLGREVGGEIAERTAKTQQDLDEDAEERRRERDKR